MKNRARHAPAAALAPEPEKPPSLTPAEAIEQVITVCKKLDIHPPPTRDTLPIWVENVLNQLIREQQEVAALDLLLKLRTVKAGGAAR